MISFFSPKQQDLNYVQNSGTDFGQLYWKVFLRIVMNQPKVVVLRGRTLMLALRLGKDSQNSSRWQEGPCPLVYNRHYNRRTGWCFSHQNSLFHCSGWYALVTYEYSCLTAVWAPGARCCTWTPSSPPWCSWGRPPCLRSCRRGGWWGSSDRAGWWRSGGQRALAQREPPG